MQIEKCKNVNTAVIEFVRINAFATGIMVRTSGSYNDKQHQELKSARTAI